MEDSDSSRGMTQSGREVGRGRGREGKGKGKKEGKEVGEGKGKGKGEEEGKEANSCGLHTKHTAMAASR